MRIWKGLSEAMMGKPGKPRKIYSEEVAVSIEGDLDDLAKSPKGLKTKELVSRLLPKIDAAIESGYSMEDILKKINDRGVDISLNTLKQYLQESRSEAPKSDSSNSDSPPAAASNSKPKKTTPKKEQANAPTSDSDSSPDSAFNLRSKIETEENSDDNSDAESEQKRGSYYREGRKVSDDFNL